MIVEQTERIRKGKRDRRASGNRRLLTIRDRLRPAWSVFKAVAGRGWPVAVAGVVVFGACRSWAGLCSSSSFKLRELLVSGGGRVSRSEILALSGVSKGMALLSIDPARVRARLLAHPIIRTATVSRRLPGHLSIRVKEHRPMALVRLVRLYLVSRQGQPFALAMGEDRLKYPVVSGIRRSLYERDRATALGRIGKALRLLRLYRAQGLEWHGRVTEVRIEPVFGYSLRLSPNRTLVRIGHGQFKRRLKRLGQLYAELYRRGVRRIKYVYLDNNRHPERVSVGLGDAIPVREKASDDRVSTSTLKR